MLLRGRLRNIGRLLIVEIKKATVFIGGKEIGEIEPVNLTEDKAEGQHRCLKAPTDFLAWRKMKYGDVCPYCGYIYL